MTRRDSRCRDACRRAADDKTLLRFLTCGSVDDGKSTLIGRLLYDTKLIFEDQLAALAHDSPQARHHRRGHRLRAAGRRPRGRARAGHHHRRRLPLSSPPPRRTFIVADTPGHEQYTRNMATGASNADLAVILIDARKGVLTQTRRHAYICSLLGIRHVVLAVNKIDLVGYRRGRLRRDRRRLPRASPRSSASRRIVADPDLGALRRQRHRAAARSMPWYGGPTLLEHLEDGRRRRPTRRRSRSASRCSGSTGPNLDFRGFCRHHRVRPRRASATPIVVAASGRTSRVTRIVTADGDLDDGRRPATPSPSTLADEIDIARGDVLVAARRAPRGRRPVRRPPPLDGRGAAAARPPLPDADRHALRAGAASPTLKHKVDVEHARAASRRSTLALNEIGLCNISTSARRSPSTPIARTARPAPSS